MIMGFLPFIGPYKKILGLCKNLNYDKNLKIFVSVNVYQTVIKSNLMLLNLYTSICY